MTLAKFFEAVGGSYEETAERLMTPERIKKFLLMFLQDTSYDELCAAMQSGDYDAAFRAAHTLKGVCANLGLEDLRKSSSDITELLRGGSENGASALLPKVTEDYERVKSAVAQLD